MTESGRTIRQHGGQVASPEHNGGDGMNSLRSLMILQLREWLRVLDNGNIPDEEAFHYSPDLFEVHRGYNYEVLEMLGKPVH
jgi:hypothetical protein